MANNYQPFLISQFKTGLFNYLDPWIRPQDAFEPLFNAYTYRGNLTKRNGSTLYGNRLDDHNPIMGIMQHINESTGLTTLIVGTTRNLYRYDVGTNTFIRLTSIVNSHFWTGTAAGITPVTTFWQNLVANTVIITLYDANGAVLGTANHTTGVWVFSAPAVFSAVPVENFATGNFSVTLAGGAVNATLSITATTTGDYFSGNIAKFFNWTNWQANTMVGSYLYITNNINPITLFDGTNLSRPIYYIDSVQADYITTCLDVQIYKNRLLVILPTHFSSAIPLNQAIDYSAIQNPTNFIADVPGNGGELIAPTGDVIQSTEFLRDFLIFFFSNSTFVLVPSGNAFDPYQFKKISVNKTTRCPFATTPYDERVTSLGNTGFIASDGVNVQRYDTPIIDFFETEISTEFFSQCYTQRYDNLNQTWMLYCSNGADRTIYPLVGALAPGSDRILIYNFAEDSWATYTTPVPLTCLGLWNNQSGTTWTALPFAWGVIDAPWKTYSGQKLMPILLGGDTNGYVYWLDNDLAVTDNGIDIKPDITSTRWNPFINTGQKTRFGYIDVYYQNQNSTPAVPVPLTLSFSVDNKTTYAKQETLSLDAPSNSNYAWKRVYVNLVGEFIQMNIDPNLKSDFSILGFILWAEPAGRLTAP